MANEFEISAMIVRVPANHPRSRTIKLQVGERFFTTERETLVFESSYFDAVLAEHRDGEEETIFVDADPHLFEHILGYLRHGHFPIFYHGATGHDIGRYQALLAEAQFFGIKKLEDWLHKEKYFEAVKTTMRCEVFPDSSAVREADGEWDSRTTVQIFPSWFLRQVYRCPRGIAVHAGDATLCGKKCLRALNFTFPQCETQASVSMLRVVTRTYLVPYVEDVSTGA
ncbi:hypothetical protein CDD82_4881 [Ophiocordyceps australis]|uniref:BTB domain-containing protein n=1 Tax=Ophiocordyceps australis TaxID=1399860 RepID=A0A2C5Z5C6_9HYPO|nr:hypothetical protein CDD82_4881 [Ophiocordyceps australis]